MWSHTASTSYYRRRTAKVVFSSLLVCLFVCSSASNVMEKLSNGLWWLVRHVTRNILEHSGDIPLNLLNTGIFSGESVSVSNMSEKLMNGFSWNCYDKLDLKQGTIWNILIMLRLKHYGKTDKQILITFSIYVGHDTTKQLARLFTTWLDRFTLPTLGMALC